MSTRNKLAGRSVSISRLATRSVGSRLKSRSAPKGGSPVKRTWLTDALGAYVSGSKKRSTKPSVNDSFVAYDEFASEPNDPFTTRMRPARPSIAPAFAAGMALWAACAVTYLQARQLETSTCMTAAGVLSAGVLVLLVAAVASKGRLPLVVACAACVGLLLGMGHAGVVHARADSMDYESAFDLELAVLEDSRDNGYSERALARVENGPMAGMVVQTRFGKGNEVRYGQLVEGNCTLKRIEEKSAEYAWQNGASCTLSMKSGQVSVPTSPRGALVTARNAAINAIGADDESHALLQALVCGYRRNVRDTQLYGCYQTCGLAHLVAVSGAHLVIVTGLFASAFRALRIPRKLSILALAGLMGAYLVVSGMPVSAIRAVAMSSIGMFSIVGKRRSSSQSALGVGAIVLIAVNPAASVSASFALSALSTAGIVVFAPLFQHVLHKTPLGRLTFVSEALSMTAAASLLSQLYACSLFYQLPLAAPFANVVCSPLFPLVCGSGLIASIAGASGLPFAGALMTASSATSATLNACVTFMADVPYASVPFYVDSTLALVVTAVMASTLWITWPCDPRKLTLAAVAAAAIGAVLVMGVPFPDAGDSIVMLDVGQGDAFFLQSKGSSLLVDTGNQDKMLLESLAKIHVTHIDSVLITHADDDHCGSLDALEKAVDVDRLIVAKDMLTCEDEKCQALREAGGRTARQLVGVAYGDTFALGSFDARVVWPHEFADNGGNADSLCVMVSYDGDDDGETDLTALFTGDAEKDEIAKMIAEGNIGGVDLLKVGHHGSKNGLTPEEAEVLHPRIALIGVGEGNRYGHPTPEALALLDDVGCTVFRSDTDGEMRCALSPDGVKVSHVG